jgi:4-hydroxy-tetrahydrodipicolinate reductase
MDEMKLVVSGASGRMGRMLIKTIHETQGAVLAGALEPEGSPAVGQDSGLLAGIGANGIHVSDDPLAVLSKADGLIDFTVPNASVTLAALAAQARIVHVVGTTGLSEADIDALHAAARHAVIIQSGNMSLGVNLLAGLVKKVAATLGPDYDIEIVEMHHRHKVDAPSGTALLLGEAAAAGRHVALKDKRVAVRDGHVGARREGDIGFATLRGGSVVGDHSVIFAGPAERLELSHKAEDRGIFARGAVRAALWGKRRKPGYYSMQDVLGL